MRTITLDHEGAALVADYYPALAPAGAPPVLLVHGWGGSGRYWRGTAERLREHFDVIVPDMPGVGRSLPVRRPYDMPMHAAALVALLRHLQVERAHVIGHSMGGGIAILLAAQQPALVERLVLTAISLFRTDAERRFFGMITEVSGVAMRLRAPWMADLAFLRRQFATRFFYRVPDDPAMLREGFLDYLGMDHGTALASARSAADHAITRAAHTIAAPTLLIAARQDQVMPPANVPFTRASIPGCEVRWIEQCGHFPMVEHPDEYTAIVREFLAAPVAAAQAIG